MTTRKDIQATTPTRFTAMARTTAALAVLLATAACQTIGAPPEPTMSANPHTQFRDLMQRPDIDQITQQYETMAANIRQRLVAEIELPEWQERTDSDSSSGCGFEFSEINSDEAVTRGLTRWASETNLPDESWPRAVQIVMEISGQHGFGTPLVLADVPGRHAISIKDSYDGEITFSTQVNTILRFRTGCHLTAEAHARGKPAGGR